MFTIWLCLTSGFVYLNQKYNKERQSKAEEIFTIDLLKGDPIFYKLESPAVFYYVANERGDICKVTKETFESVSMHDKFNFEVCIAVSNPTE